MKSWLVAGVAVLLGLVALTACGPGGLFEDSSQRATREAQSTLYAQTVFFVETQASTLVALQATAESAAIMGTQVAQLSAQNRSLQATIDAALAGVPPAQNLQPQPPAGQPNQAVQPSAGSTPLFPNLTPTQVAGAVYSEATTARFVRDSDGCAEEAVSVFAEDEDRIYMAVKAQNIQPGTTFYTRWLYNNQPQVDTAAWTPDKFFSEICIWFYIEPTDVAFVPGNWSVQLIADEVAVVSRNFQIGGAAGQAATPSQ